jgi:hypothetical protein
MEVANRLFTEFADNASGFAELVEEEGFPALPDSGRVSP